MTHHRGLIRSVISLVAAAALLTPGAAAAQQVAERGSRLPVIYNDFGAVGLLQTPTARFAPDGQMTTGVSRVYPYNRLLLTLQGLPWLEGTFRYSEIENVFFSPFASFSGDQTFKDRGVDLKARLLRESRLMPQVAVGLRDIGGTQVFGAEYIVASKRWYDFDFSLGLGLGNMGTRADVRNPLSLFSEGFKTRPTTTGAGAFTVNQFFRGENAALFGGIQWRTPIEGLSLLAEMDPNDYQSEALQNNAAFLNEDERDPFPEIPFRFNFGAVYSPFPWLQLATGVERGDEAMFRVNVVYNIADPDGIIKFDDPPVPLKPRPAVLRPAEAKPTAQPAALYAAGPRAMPAQPAAGADNWLIVDRLFTAFEQRGLALEDLAFSHRHAVFTVAAPGVITNAAVAEAARLAAGLLPVPLDTLSFKVMERGLVSRSLLFDAAELQRPGPRVSLVADAGATLSPDAARPVPAFDEAAVAKAMFEDLGENRMAAEAIQFAGPRVTAFVFHRDIRQVARAVGRAARVVHNHAPAHIEQIEIVLINGDLPQNRILLLRQALEKAVAERRGPAELIQRTEFLEPPARIPWDAVANPGGFPRFSWGINPRLRQHVGGADGFYFGQLWLALTGNLKLARGLNLNTQLGQNLYNNFDGLKQASDSQLPKVRSDIVQYLKQGESNLVRLQGSYHFGIAPGWYGRLTGGILEEMYGGVSAELLYRPFGEPWAVGLEVNRVRQRTFEQRLEFQDYQVNTGHLSFYGQIPAYDMLAAVHAGQYLAGDKGVTFEVFRDFPSGVRFGLFTTFTDVSAEEFGEGEFDKGFFISIPLDLFFIKSSKGRFNLPFRPLTRDGGQRLYVTDRLYGLLERGSRRDFDRDIDRILD